MERSARSRAAAKENKPSEKLSRATFIRMGTLALGGAITAPGLTAAFPATANAANASAKAASQSITPRTTVAAEIPRPAIDNPPGSVLAPNRSGGIPEGPSSYGFMAEDLLNWTPESDPLSKHFVCHIPRAERIAPFAPTQAHPRLDPGVQMLAIDADYRGSIYDERARAIGDEDYVYTFRYWPYLDIFSSWHGQLTPDVPEAAVIDRDAEGRTYGVLEVPNAGWTEAAHKNGARSLGCWFWPRDGANFDALLVQDAQGGYPVADKLIELRQYFGFDGYFINQEAALTSAQASRLRAFMEYLRATDADGYIQWYDAMLPSGQLSYQNMINTSNVSWLGTPEAPLCDSIFINYGWLRGWGTSGEGGPDPDLTRTAATVRNAGFDPYQTAFGTSEFQMGGFNPSERYSDLAMPGKTPPVSWGTFVINEMWQRGCSDGTTRTPEGRALYREAEQRFWSGPRGNPLWSGRLSEPSMPGRTNIWNYEAFDGVANAIVEKSPYSGLPINHTFNIGVGSGFWIAGEQVSATPWNNAGSADVAPTWQYWIDEANPDSTNARIDESLVWEGAHSLAITTAAGADIACTLHLFKTDLMINAPTQVRIVAATAGELTLNLVLTPYDDPTTQRTIRLSPSEAATGGWQTYTGVIPETVGRIARISLSMESPGDGSSTSQTTINLGQICLTEALTTVATPQDFRVSGYRRTETGWQAYFDWTLAEDAAAYDVFEVQADRKEWLGRVHRDCFFIDRADAAPATEFELIAIAADGTRSEPVGAVPE